MTRTEYNNWCEASSEKRRYLTGTLDKIVIFGYPIGRKVDLYFEGTVVSSDTALFPVGYRSCGWCAEHFECILRK